MTDVLLVTAPFLSVLRPALGVSNLSAVLQKQSIDCQISYLNMAFADWIGVDLNEFVCEDIPTSLLVGEAVFSDKMHSSGPEALGAYLRSLSRWISGEKHRELMRAFEQVEPFLKQMADELLQKQPRIIGFSSTFQQNCASLQLARLIKAKNPGIITVFGGANCEGPMGAAILKHHPQVDQVFSGEAENSFPEFVQKAIKESATKPMPRETRPSLPVDMTSLPVPDYSDYFAALNNSSYQHRIRPTILFETSRGCWWGAKHHCRFCGLNGDHMNYRSKTDDQVLDELQYLSRHWSVNDFQAADNIMDLQHVNTVFRQLPELLPDARFFFEIKANMKYQQLQTIADAGVKHVQPGIESLDDAVLQELEKGVTAAQNVCLLRDCAELGIKVIWNILCGIPHDTAEQYQQMAALVPLLEHLDPPSGCSVVRLDRFSPYHEKPAQTGYQNIQPCEAYRHVYDLSDEALEQLAYFFTAEPTDVPDFDYVKPLREAISQWQQAVRESAHLPELKLLSTGGFHLIKDTRQVAGEALSVISPEEAQLLIELRRPGKIKAVMARMADQSVDWLEVHQRLLDKKLLAILGERSVTLAVMPDLQTQPEPESPVYPGGQLLKAPIIPLQQSNS
jgi:ribosomal peptide maturation radical SAM protein 1